MKGGGTKKKLLRGSAFGGGAIGYAFRPRQRGQSEYDKTPQRARKAAAKKKAGLSGAKIYTVPGTRWRLRKAQHPYWCELVRANQAALREAAWVRRAEKCGAPYSLDRLKKARAEELAARQEYNLAKNQAA